MADTFKGIITADGKKRTFAREGITPEYASDKTLSVDGGFADAKVTGDVVKSLMDDLVNHQKTKTCTTTFIERGDMLYLVQNIYGKLQRVVSKLPKNCISISSLRSCREWWQESAEVKIIF